MLSNAGLTSLHEYRVHLIVGILGHYILLHQLATTGVVLWVIARFDLFYLLLQTIQLLSNKGNMCAIRRWTDTPSYSCYRRLARCYI